MGGGGGEMWGCLGVVSPPCGHHPQSPPSLGPLPLFSVAAEATTKQCQQGQQR